MRTLEKWYWMAQKTTDQKKKRRFLQKIAGNCNNLGSISLGPSPVARPYSRGQDNEEKLHSSQKRLHTRAQKKKNCFGNQCPEKLHLSYINIFLWNYSQGQKHVIQLRNSQELISPNMSSLFQLENSPELNFISTWRCQLDDFRGTPLEFCFGGPSLSACCGTNVLCPQIREFPRKYSTLRLLEERPRDGKSPKVIDFTRKHSTLRRREERARVPTF